MSIQSEITRISTSVSAQTNLISQISQALEGKASGVGANIETYTVTVADDLGIILSISYVSFNGGKIELNYIAQDYSSSSWTLNNVCKGITMFIELGDSVIYELSNAEQVRNDYSIVGTEINVFRINGDATIRAV